MPDDGDKSVVELDLHGLLSIRLIGAHPRHVAQVERQLGAVRWNGTGSPDLVVRFVPTVSRGAMTRLGLISAAVTDDAFIVLDSTGQAAVQLPFGEVRQPCELVYRQSLTKLPLLLDVVRLLLPIKGHVAVHASACVYRGTGIMLMGWPKGGKTGALLAFGDAGAHFVGDEWILLSEGGGHMYGLPLPIQVSHHHEWAVRRAGVRPHLRRALLRSALRQLDRGKVRVRVMQTATMSHVLRHLHRRARVGIDPRRLFARSAHADGWRPDVAVLVIDHDGTTPSIEPTDATSLAQSMAAVDHYEDAELLRLYDGFRFSRPGTADPAVERVHARRTLLMQRAFSKMRTFVAKQPYGAPLTPLLDALVARL
jgi:hypothetical protein